MAGQPRIEEETPRPTGFWERFSVILLMAMVLSVAGLLSAMTAMRFTIRGREVTVPAVAGMTQAEAAELLFENGLGLDVESTRFSDTVPEGRIIDQNPSEGVSVKTSRSVRVLLSLGERQFPVPDVEGNRLRSAQMLLGQSGLSVGNTLYSHTGTGAASTIVYQSPPAGDMSGMAPEVNVLVSMGPIDDYYIMPDLTGEPASAATARIRNEGFRLGDITYTAQAGMAGGRVMGQNPQAGHKISKTDIIRLEVSE